MKSDYHILGEVLQGLMPPLSRPGTRCLRHSGDHDQRRVLLPPCRIENDHIAFRSLGVPLLGITSLEKIFLHLGYTRRDPYFFPEKKLERLVVCSSRALPSPYLSQRAAGTGPCKQAQAIIYRYTQTLTSDPADSLDMNDAAAIDHFLHSKRLAHPKPLEDYRDLAAESEYAAWVIYNRYYLNHFTISVHNLPQGITPWLNSMSFSKSMASG